MENKETGLDPKVQYVLTKFQDSRNYYRAMKTRFTNYDRLNFGIPETKPETWMSNVFVPATYKAIDTIQCRIMNVIFATNPPFDLEGVEDSDRPFEGVVKSLIKFQLENKIKFYSKFTDFLNQLLVRGTSFAKIYWRKDIEERKFRVEVKEPVMSSVMGEDGIPMMGETGEPLMEQTGLQTRYSVEKKNVVTYDDPEFTVIDAWDIYPEPGAKNIKDGFVVQRIVTSYDSILKHRKVKYEDGTESGIYQNVEKILYTTFPNDESWHHPRLSELGLSQPQPKGIIMPPGVTRPEEKTKQGTADVELLEAYGGYAENGKLENKLFTIANRSVLIRDEANPFWHGRNPFIRAVFKPVLNELFGRGVPELVMGLQNELNDKRNQRLDNVNLCLQKILTYVEDAIEPEIIKNFVFKPGGKMPVRDINALKWDSPQDVTMSAYKEEELIVHDIQETTAATAHLMPSASTGDLHRTASGIAMLSGMAGEKLKPVIRLIEEMGIEETVEMIHLLNQQFITDERIIRILGKDNKYPSVTPKEISHNFDFICFGSTSMMQKETRINQLLRAIELSAKIPEAQQATDWNEVIRTIWETLDFDPEKFLLSEEEKQAMREKQLRDMLIGGAIKQGPGKMSGGGPIVPPGANVESMKPRGAGGKYG